MKTIFKLTKHSMNFIEKSLDNALLLHYHKYMSKAILCKSALTDRYQTTIPKSVRDTLKLKKRDKISYIEEDNGKIVIVNSKILKSDPAIEKFLEFLENDIFNHPENIKPISKQIVNKAHKLTKSTIMNINESLKDEGN